ncbi:hypothetical protein L1987_04671 [Smallanthus sonchifolius]|uniref:Uncharacterized protein n=1 Tax=Smallanthus sonchifolius TaxID=185202 RepID=A0ACB9JTD3_9ASTR|nr:hypothetical protein L1987_04671 [Smallanthus sonchifolius]
MRGHLTSKADVFGFGVVCMEILSGRPNYDEKLDPEQKYLLQWPNLAWLEALLMKIGSIGLGEWLEKPMLRAWTLYESNRQLELIDPSLSSFNEQEATRMIGVALLCVQASPALRPAMSRVIAMLSGDVEINPVMTKPSYLTDWDFNDITNTFCDDEPISSENTTMMTATTTTTSTGVESMSSHIMSEVREGR